MRPAPGPDGPLPLLQAALDAVADAVSITDREGRYLLVNAAAAKALGRPAADCLGATDADFYDDESCARMQEDDRRVRDSGEPLVREVRVTRADGERALLMSKRPYRGPDGQVGGIITITRDVTRRRHAEAAFQRSEERNQALLDAIPDLIFITSPDDTFLDYHATNPSQLLVPPEWFLGRRVSDVLPAEIAAELKRCFDRVRETGRVERLDLCLPRPDGPHHYEARIAPYGDDRLISIVHDITERKNTERALRESEELFRQLAECIDDVFWVADATLRAILYVSPAYERVWGRPRQGHTIEPRAFLDTIHPDDRPRVEAALAARRNEGTYREEFRIVRPDGTVRWVEERAFPLRNERGTVYRVVGVSTDITERVLASQERERLIRELERKNSELEQFTYTVSHDLKSPLVTIKGFLGFVERAAEAGQLAQVRADLGRIGAAADHMRRLLDDLLQLSRIGRIVHPPRPVPLGPLVRKVLGILSGLLTSRGVQVDVASDLPVLFADPVRLEEVLVNLLTNAAKFMGSQPAPRIEIGTRTDGAETVCFIRDNGIGVDAHYRERIFGLFERLDPRTEGTGIGLALVRRIIEVHGGRVWVESEGVGKGSTFCFTVPPAPLR